MAFEEGYTGPDPYTVGQTPVDPALAAKLKQYFSTTRPVETPVAPAGPVAPPVPSVSRAAMMGQVEAINNVDEHTSDGHGPKTVSMTGGTATYTPGNAATGLAALSGGDRDFTARLQGPQHVDMQALTGNQMGLDEALQARMQARDTQAQQGIMQEKNYGEQAAGTDLGEAREGYERSKLGALTQDPFLQERLKTQGAVAAAAAPNLVRRETQNQQLGQYRQLPAQAEAILKQSIAGWDLKKRQNPQAAQQLIDKKVEELAEPLNRAFGNEKTTVRQNDLGF